MESLGNFLKINVEVNGFKMKLEGLFNRGTKNVISKGNNNQVKKPRKKPIKINFSNTKIGAITPNSPKKEKKKNFQ